MTRVSRVVGCLCLAMVFGCPQLENPNPDGKEEGDQPGDGDGSGGPGQNIGGPRSGVDEDTSVGELSDEDAEKFCAWAVEQFAALVPSNDQICTFAGLAAGDAAQCEEARASCAEQIGNQPPPSDQSGELELEGCVEGVSEALNSGCDVTIADLEACFSDTVAAAKGFFDSLTCESAGMSAPPEEIAPPASCAVIEQKCPDLAVEEEEGGFEPGDDDYPGDDYPGDDYPGDDYPGDDYPDDDYPGNDEPIGDEPVHIPSCADGTPIDGSQFCDGVVDCAEGEDEAFCDAEPPPAPRLKVLRPRFQR